MSQENKSKPSVWEGLKTLGKAIVKKALGIKKKVKKREVKTPNANRVAGSYLTSKETKKAQLDAAGK